METGPAFTSLPPMSQNQLDVRYVAGLARLELSDEEIAEFQPQLNAIMEHVEALKELDIEGIEPTAHAAPVFDRMRNDEPHTSLPQLLLTTIGLGVAMLGCLSAMPIVSLPAAGKGKLQKTFLILLGLALLVSAFGTWFIAQRTISEFAYMKESGAPDPHSFGQAMAVGVWRVGRVALLLASLYPVLTL